MSSNPNNIGATAKDLKNAKSFNSKGKFRSELKAKNDSRADTDLITGKPKAVVPKDRASAPGRKKVINDFTQPNSASGGFDIISNGEAKKPAAKKPAASAAPKKKAKATEGAPKELPYDKDFDVVTGAEKTSKPTRNIAKKGSYKKLEQANNDPYDIMGNPKAKVTKQKSVTGKFRHEVLENGADVNPITGTKKAPVIHRKASSGSIRKEVEANAKNTNPVTGTEKTPIKYSNKEPKPSPKNKVQPINQTNPLTGEAKPFRPTAKVPSGKKATAKEHAHVNPITGAPKNHRVIKKSTSGSMSQDFLGGSGNKDGFNIISNEAS